MLMRRVPLCVASVLALVVLWTPAAAVAHGPCGCLNPMVVQAGTQVRITETPAQREGVSWPAYRAVFNPRPSDFGIAPDYLASAYRADVPTTTVLSRPRRAPTLKGRFRVPKGTPPGLYMVLIWDGEEGGAHNTWDYLHVTDRGDPDRTGGVAQQQEPAKPADGNSPALQEPTGSNASTAWPLIAGIGLGGLILGVVGSRLVARRRA